MRARYALLLMAGTIFGGVAFNARPAYAIFDSISIVAAITALQTATEKLFSALGDQVTSSLTDLTNPNSVSSMLRNGFQQLTNYSKAQVGANEQIADASNSVMANYMKQMRNTEIRDEHLPSGEFCTTLDSNQTAVAASTQARTVAGAIEAVTDPRGEAAPNTPSYFGRSQGVEANSQMHLQKYCADPDVQAGLCSSLSKFPNGDERASSLFGKDTYADGGVDAANDFATNLIQPVAPAALRGDQLTSVSGKEAWTSRRSYNARMSLARSVLDYTIGQQTPAVTLTADQQAEMQAEGQTPVTQASWLQAISIEVNRRVFGREMGGVLTGRRTGNRATRDRNRTGAAKLPRSPELPGCPLQREPRRYPPGRRYRTQFPGRHTHGLAKHGLQLIEIGDFQHGRRFVHFRSCSARAGWHPQCNPGPSF